jgi:hypothetical protein
VQTGPDGTTEYAKTIFDANGREIESVYFDGTDNRTDYNPITGEVLDTWTDVNGNGVFDPGIESKQFNNPSAATTNDNTPSGDAETDQSTTGNQSDSSGTDHGGLDSTATVDGETATTHTALGTSGNDTVTTTNPDGTQTIDSYSDGLLSEEDSKDAAGNLTGKTTYGYDAVARNTSITSYQKDSSGSLTVGLTTSYTLRADGSVSQTQTPDGTITVNSFDPLTETPKSITTPDGTIMQGVDSKGNVTSQSGGGVLPTTYGYDPNTAALSDINLFPSGSTSDSTGEQTTHYGHDASGALISIKYGYNASADTYLSQDQFHYN